MEAARKSPRQLIEEDELEVKPELLPDAVVDENVDMHLIRKYLTIDAWDLLMEVVTHKKKKPCIHMQKLFT